MPLFTLLPSGVSSSDHRLPRAGCVSVGALIVLLLAACTPGSENASSVSSQQTDAAPSASNEARSASAGSESARLNGWFDEKYEAQLQMSPNSLTSLGRKEQYDQIDHETEAEADRQLAWLGETVAELKSEFDYAQLDAEAQTSYDLWVLRYEDGLEAARYRRQNYVFDQMGGAHTGPAEFLINLHKVDDESDAVAYIKRIKGVGRSIKELLDRAKVHAEQGIRPPSYAYDAVIDESTKLISGAPFAPQRPATEIAADASATESPLWTDIRGKLAGLVESGAIDEARSEQLLGQAQTALLENFEPAYRELIDWFSADIDNADIDARGVGSREDGESFYNYQLRRRTTTDLSADEIHEIGLQEVARIQAEMNAIKDKVGFKGSLQDFFKFLKEDDQFYFPNNDEGAKGYITSAENFLGFITERLPDYFGILPKAELEVKRVEAFREQDGGAQFYSRGAPDGSRPGVFYAHLSDMRAMPKTLLEAIAYHEGNPGHHMQISIAQELTEIPVFRTLTFHTAYVEGWALYSELLAKEMGAYEDDYSNFGRLSTEIWRAVRLVVDTGIHAKGWSEEQAIAYFRENTAVADGAVQSEVRRYTVWPGQATAYKIGMLKILELREFAQTSLGPKFDIRAFHDTVLGGGSLPLTLLEKRVKRWVASQS